MQNCGDNAVSPAPPSISWLISLSTRAARASNLFQIFALGQLCFCSCWSLLAGTSEEPFKPYELTQISCFFTCSVDQVVGRLVLFASQRGHTRNSDEHRRAVYDLPGNGPASLVVPRHPARLQRRGILRWHHVREWLWELKSSIKASLDSFRCRNRVWEICGEYKPSGEWRSDPGPWPDTALRRAWRSVWLKWSAGHSRRPRRSCLSWGRAARGLDADRNRELLKGGPDTSRDNGGDYFMNGQPDISQPGNDTCNAMFSPSPHSKIALRSAITCQLRVRQPRGFNPPLNSDTMSSQAVC